MQFTGADILVLGIVLIVLAVYRQFDRNNRSLEKVKRYANRVHDELESHVQEKVVTIKDMGIELEVHQKAAREVLKRVQEIESSLNSRSSEIETIGTRINEYDGALNELVEMTARAQENIGRVRDESAYVDGVGRRIKQSQDRIESVEKGLSTVIQKFQDENLEQLKETQAQAFDHANQKAETIQGEIAGFQERVNQYSEYIRGVEERGESIADRVRIELDEILQTSINRAQEASIQSSEHITEIKEQFDVLETDYQKRLLDLAERGENLETSALAKLREQIESRAQAVAKELSQRLDGHKRATLERVQGALNQMDEAQADLSSRESRLQESRNQLEVRISQFSGDLTSQIEQAADGLQQKVLGDLERRLDEYESQMTYRFEKLGDVGSEVEGLQERLREAMESVAGRVREEFAQFVREFGESRSQQRNAVETEMAGLREQMSELETGLVDLKNQAYENVNAKLQVFEDEFFKDLKERQVAMEQRLIDWQAGFQQEIDEISQSARQERAEVEEGYQDEIRRKLTDLQQSAYGRFEKLEEEVLGFQRGIDLRVSDSRELIASLEREIEQEIQQLAADSKSGLRAEFTRHRDEVGGQLDEIRRGLNTDIQELERDFASGKAELETVLDTSRNEAVAWKSQVDQKLQSTTGDVNQQIADFRVSVNGTLAELRDSFGASKEEALAANAAERERLQAELDDLSGQVNRVTDDIRIKSEEALSEFGERYAELRLDSDKQSKSMTADLDSRVKDFRTFVQDSRDQFNAMQERLLGKLNEETQTLATTLQEIDRKQKGFVDQTRIFERADALKDQLEAAIQTLKTDMDRVEIQRKEVKDIELQFNRVRKAADEVTDKMSRFMAEKRRIDVLEEDYKKLITMGQAVELKLDHVTSSNDKLQTMQASIRSLEDLEKDVETRFQRLEKKRSILDLTSEGVDRNFQELQEIEQRLNETSANLATLPEKIEELSTRMQQLAANKRDADAAMKQLALLDQTMEEIEGRMENLTQAREWLARTETRLEEVQTEAEDQVKLLGALLKQEGRGPAAGSESAPPVTTRDTVIKLARQSWKVDEIARATSLSRGEVELILELATK